MGLHFSSLENNSEWKQIWSCYCRSSFNWLVISNFIIEMLFNSTLFSKLVLYRLFLDWTEESCKSNPSIFIFLYWRKKSIHESCFYAQQIRNILLSLKSDIGRCLFWKNLISSRVSSFKYWQKSLLTFCALEISTFVWVWAKSRNEDVDY